MEEKIWYFAGDSRDGILFKRYDSYDKAMKYIKDEYEYDVEHDGEPDCTFIDGYYAIYSITAEEAEHYGWDMVRDNPNTRKYLGTIYYDDTQKYVFTEEFKPIDKDSDDYDVWEEEEWL